MQIEGEGRITLRATLTGRATVLDALSGLLSPFGIGDDPPLLPGVKKGAGSFPLRGADALPTFSVPTIQAGDAQVIRLAYLSPLTRENVQAFLRTLPAGPELAELAARSANFDLSDHEFKHLYQPFADALAGEDVVLSSPVGWLTWGDFQTIAQAALLSVAGEGDSLLAFGFLEDVARLVAALWDAATDTAFASPGFVSPSYAGHANERNPAADGGPGARVATLAQYRDWVKRYGNPFAQRHRRRTVAGWTEEAMAIIADGGLKLKACRRCGRFFLRGNTRQRFCSDTCRSVYFTAKKRARDKEDSPRNRTDMLS